MKNQFLFSNVVMFFAFIILCNYSILAQSKNITKSSKKEVDKMTNKLFKNFDKNITNITIHINDIDLKIFCKNHCSFQGYCLEAICFCKPGFTGEDCSRTTSEVSCLNNCNNNGECSQEGQCICKEGYQGP